MGHNAQFEIHCPGDPAVILLLGFTRGPREQSNELQKVQVKLILLVQKIQMAELPALKDLFSGSHLKAQQPKGSPSE